jgi:molybdopterin-guanine dinucleotide biosynthesis protein A
MTFDALLIGDMIDHGSEILVMKIPVLEIPALMILVLAILVLKSYNPGLHDNAPDQSASLCIGSYYGCHMALRYNPRRCREDGHDQHQYKTRSQGIVPKNHWRCKHQCYHPDELTVSSTNRSPVNRAGWVLVGGRSRRMGTDKALIEIGDQPLFRRVAVEVGKICGTVSLVGDPVVYGGLGLPVIPDRFSGQGPLAGIEAALSATNVEWNLIAACDMPSLEASIFKELFAAAEGSDGAVPSYEDGRIEPLCAVFHARCHAAILAALEGGVRKVSDALAPLALRYVPVSSPDSFANLNTPEDLKHYAGRRDG